MIMRLWQVAHTSGQWKPSQTVFNSAFDKQPEVPVEDNLENFWIPEGFVPPGWDDMKFRSALAILLNDNSLVYDRRYAINWKEGHAQLKTDFPDGCALVWDQLTDLTKGPEDHNNHKILRLVSLEEANRLEEEGKKKGVGSEAR